MQDIRQSENYAKYLHSLGWNAIKKNGNYYFSKSILPFFTLIKLQRPKSINLDDIGKIAGKYKGLVQFIIEPVEESLEYKQILPYLPSKTIILEFKKDSYNNLSKDARYAIRKNEKTKIKEEKNLEKFYMLWKANVPRSRYVLPLDKLIKLKKAFAKNAVFLLSEDENAGAIFLKANDTAYYWYGFTNETARKNLTQYKIIYEGLLWSKRQKAKYFDFEGIYDERFPINAWTGFSNFKKKFGGKVKEFPGAYKKIFWKVR